MSETRINTASPNRSKEISLFPSSLDNQKASTLFMRRILFVIVSDVLKKRQLLPSLIFKDVLIDGLKCCIVAEDTDLGQKLSALLFAMSEAVEKHYLRDLLLLISAEETDKTDDEVIEVYTLTFTYADGGGLLVRSPSHEFLLSCKNGAELRKQVYALFGRLEAVINMMSPLPPTAFPYFKLTYYGGTPLCYEPAGFKPSPTTYRIKDNIISSRTSVGFFSTKFESCAMHIESVFLESEFEHQDSGEAAEDKKKKQTSSPKSRVTKVRERVTDETPTGRPRKERKREKAPSTDRKKRGKRSKAIREKDKDDDGGAIQTPPLVICSTVSRSETSRNVSQENVNDVVETMRASSSEENFPNALLSDEANKAILRRSEGVTSGTDLQTSNICIEYPGGSEEVPESSGQFSTFGSLTGPYIESPRMDSTTSLPTITELVNRQPALGKSPPVKSSSPKININAEFEATRGLFARHSPEIESTDAEPNVKRMKISRSKCDFYRD